MLSNEWKKLQNGSDIRGVAIEGIEDQSVNLQDVVVEKIASSFAIWLSTKKNKPLDELTISIGNDSRLSADTMRAAIIKGLTVLGCRVLNCGLASTPAMFVSTIAKGYEYDGAIMITASHLPFNRNGMKFFINEGGLNKGDITDILNIAEAGTFKNSPVVGQVSDVDFISVYAESIVDKIRSSVNSPINYLQPLSGFKIIVDAGNGAGGFFVDKVLAPLGANTTGSQFLDPDGSFPNHIPNPEDKIAMESIQSAVLRNNADFGIIFDTDVDRAGAVDKNGKEINRNRIIALLSAITLEEHPGSTIVTDSITSSGLKQFIENDLKGVHLRFKRGYKNVINEAIRLNNNGVESHLAIETSGHGAIKENYFLDDGAYMIAKILIKMAKLKLENNKSIDTLIENLQEPLESSEFRMNITIADFKEYGTQIVSDLNDYASKNPEFMIEPDNFEGIRVSFNKNEGDGWFLLRLSLHDPLMPLNIESNTLGGVKLITSKLYNFLSSYKNIDLSPLKEFTK